MKDTIWKRITAEGLGLYYVSNTGRVKKEEFLTKDGRRRKEKEIKPQLFPNGYVYVNLVTDDGRHFMKTVHRLVAEAFVENPDPDRFDQVNHLDENKGNNSSDNLEWCDQSMNIRYGVGYINRCRNRWKPVVRMDPVTLEALERYDSEGKAAEAVGTKQPNMSAAIKHGWLLKGFRWRFADR